MNYQIKVKGGNQVLASSKNQNRPTIVGLDQRLLGNGPSPHDIIEVTGEASTGKSMLLLQWISRAILAPSGGGLGAGVLLLDTDHHQPMSTLVNLMEAQLKFHNSSIVPPQRLTYAVAESLIKDALKRLTILSVYDSTQLYAAFLSLDKILHSNPLISMVVIDSLPAFFWADRLAGGVQHMDSYIHQLLTVAQKSLEVHKVVTVFTRPSHFQSATSRSKPKDGFRGSTIFISLSVNEAPKGRADIVDNNNRVYSVAVRSGVGQISFKYHTSKEGFVWV